MNSKTSLYVLSLVLATFFHSCKGTDPTIPDQDLKVLKIEDVLNGDDENLKNLLTRVRGSIGVRGPASKTIWTRKNDYGLGLYVSANHVYGVSTWSSRSAEFFDLYDENPGIFLSSQIVSSSGNLDFGNVLSADFPLMHFDISSDASNTNVLPSEDFYLGIIDNQRVEQSQLAVYPERVQTATPLELFDPVNRTIAEKTWNVPVFGEMAIAVGYPQDKLNYPKGAAVYGLILSDTEAEQAMLNLKTTGDAEGSIPYNRTVEFFLEGQGLAGMSGGGVFNSDGQLLGIMVRSSDVKDAPRIIRVVKISYIKSKIDEFYNKLSEKEKLKVKPFISGEL